MRLVGGADIVFYVCGTSMGEHAARVAYMNPNVCATHVFARTYANRRISHEANI